LEQKLTESTDRQVTGELNDNSKPAFLEGMNKLNKHANKFIDQGGMYFEE
jgi:hypothetical protein